MEQSSLENHSRGCAKTQILTVCLFVCIYICMNGHHIQQSMDQPGKILLVVRKLYFICPRSRLRIWSRETGSAVPSRVSLLISTLRLNLVHTHGIPPDFPRRHPFIYLNHHTPSGQYRVYRVTQLRNDGVHSREPAGTGPVNLKVVPVTGAGLCKSSCGPINVRLSFPTPTVIGMEWL